MATFDYANQQLGMEPKVNSIPENNYDLIPQPKIDKHFCLDVQTSNLGSSKYKVMFVAKHFRQEYKAMFVAICHQQSTYI